MTSNPIELPASGRRTRSTTRDKVLRHALCLFNERGVPRVTTADIADAAAINEGNLYYYFQRKEQLVEALFERFANAMVAAAEQPIADPASIESYIDYQRGWFGLMWDYRFFYRDNLTVRALAPALRGEIATLNARAQLSVRDVFSTMASHDLLQASSGEIDVLVSNIWIVSAYWMDFLALQKGRHEQEEVIQSGDLEWGFRQVEMLYRPYLASRPVDSRMV